MTDPRPARRRRPARPPSRPPSTASATAGRCSSSTRCSTGRAGSASCATRCPGIAPNILTDRLRRLERERILVATPYSTRPPRMEYTLTGDGRDLASALRLLADWGEPADGLASRSATTAAGRRSRRAGTARRARSRSADAEIERRGDALV